MPLYFSPYRGSGTKADPFRPAGSDQAGWSAVDIRLDPTVLDGAGIAFALLWLPAGSTDPTGSIKLADDYGDLLTAQQRNRLNQRTGLDFSADTTIQDALETIMLRADTVKWKRLRPCRGIYEVWLGSGSGKRKWVDLPAVAGGSISDNFNRSNETPIASPWTQLSGSGSTVNLSSNAITHASTGDTFYYYSNGGGWNADQSSQFQYVSSVNNNDWGPAVRIGSNGFSGYWYSQSALGGARGAEKYVNNSYTHIEDASGTTATGNPYKISIAGSTISYYDNGSANANSPATDTSLSTAGNGAGVFFYDTGGSIDDFLATGEISAAVASLLFTRHPMAAMIGR